VSAEAAPAGIAVEVVWSPASRETCASALRLPPGATVADALVASGIAALAAAGQGEQAWAATGLSAAVWSRARPLDHPLREGDRVEVLRGLLVDPMDARRTRYQEAGGVDALRKRGYAGRKR
jgi:putative ubiquitin-RnfH superfamily antitoxin RatB of RatAB toxin-antitoxin module